MGNPYYAGIGSRKTPKNILAMMTAIAIGKRSNDCILRSGGADGADTAFEEGAGDQKEIYLATTADTPTHFGPPSYDAIELSAKYHPAWSKCSPFTKLLHGRNAHIILGRDLKTPVNIVICWTEGGKGGGGTGQGIRIANGYGIEVRDLGEQYWLDFYQRIVGLGTND